jgi:hypothetical protein
LFHHFSPNLTDLGNFIWISGAHGFSTANSSYYSQLALNASRTDLMLIEKSNSFWITAKFFSQVTRDEK